MLRFLVFWGIASFARDTQKDKAYASWAADVHHLPCIPHYALVSCGLINSNKPPPSSAGSLPVSTVAISLLASNLPTAIALIPTTPTSSAPTRATRPSARVRTRQIQPPPPTCLCSWRGAGNDAFEALMHVHLGTKGDTASSEDGTLGCVHLTSHTVKHVLLDCPLTTHLCCTILSAYIFGTEAGGWQLCHFLYLSQCLLRLLPLQPS